MTSILINSICSSDTGSYRNTLSSIALKGSILNIRPCIAHLISFSFYKTYKFDCIVFALLIHVDYATHSGLYCYYVLRYDIA